jgi:hypothetical protein
MRKRIGRRWLTLNLIFNLPPRFQSRHAAREWRPRRWRFER